MTLADKVALVALFLNIVALGVVVYQTHVSRKALFAARESLDATRQSVEMSIKARQLENLPEANLLIVVMQSLTGWQKDLEKFRQDLEAARRRGPDDPLIKTIARQRGLNSPKGLVEKLYYEHCPRWLQMIWMTGANHYYKCKHSVPLLWDFRKNIPDSGAEDLIDQCDESIGHISELRSYIINSVPAAYLKSPDALSEDRFLDE